MAENIPTWLMKRYAKMWKKFHDKPFSYEDVFSLLNEKDTISVILSELRKAGWLEAKLNPEDTRKRIYVLKKPDKVINDVINSFN